jgi:hypothetical protein
VVQKTIGTMPCGALRLRLRNTAAVSGNLSSFWVKSLNSWCSFHWSLSLVMGTLRLMGCGFMVLSFRSHRTFKAVLYLVVFDFRTNDFGVGQDGIGR